MFIRKFKITIRQLCVHVLCVLTMMIFTACVASLDSLAADYERQSQLNFTTVFAGVVFEGVEENGNITNATIKIRMNSTSIVDPTELAAP